MSDLERVRFYLGSSVLDLLSQHCNIVGGAVMQEIDHDWAAVAAWLQGMHRDQFDPADRIIVVHQDSDYYLPNGYGINLNNLFETWTDCNIPVYTMLLYTNHFGIAQEIEQICQWRKIQDRPTIIEAPITEYPGANFPDPVLAADQIVLHAVSMMAGSPRSHRFALYNHLQHLSPDYLAVTIKP
jgi:hypothetical protein